MFKEIHSRLLQKHDLSTIEMGEFMEELVRGKFSDDEIEKFLLALRDKGETEAEISAAAGVLSRHAVKLSRPFPGLLDTCGTGGDGRSTFNVSTVASIVACAAGVRIGKHGNRAVSGKTGSADLMELLGVKIDLSPAGWEKSIDETGYAFFFAPLYHPAVRQASAARKRIAGKTLFNILGPLLNPARAEVRLLGVYHERLLRILGPALHYNGATRALVVRGQDGLDEISLTGPTDAAHYTLGRNGHLERLRLEPHQAGLQTCAMEELVCASAEQSKADALAVLSGKPGPKLDWTVLNAGAAIWIAGLAPDLALGARVASETIQTGAAIKKLGQIADFSRSFSV